MTPAGRPKRGFRGPLNAWALTLIDPLMHRVYGERKERLFASLPNTVVEIGPGMGANFRYYAPGSRVIAIEPSPHMHDGLQHTARRFGIDADVRRLPAERIELRSASVAAVICTFVLCSVDDPASVLSEVRRILEPGGQFLFIEHVAAPHRTPLRTLQRVLRAPWSWCLEGCHTDRETWRYLEDAGFPSLELSHFRVNTPLIHLAPHIAGVAVN